MSDKSKADLEAENAELKQQIEDLESESQTCPNCGFNPTEHAERVKEATPA